MIFWLWERTNRLAVYASRGRFEFGNYPTLSSLSLTGDFVPLSGNP